MNALEILVHQEPHESVYGVYRVIKSFSPSDVKSEWENATGRTGNNFVEPDIDGIGYVAYLVHTKRIKKIAHKIVRDDP